MPNIILEDVEDAYTFFVSLLGVEENVFWKSDISFLLSVVENKNAYDSFITWNRYKMSK